VQQRVLMAAGTNQFVFNCTPAVKEYLLKEGTDPRYGARHLKRAIERNLVFPLANLVATGQVKLGDFVRVDMASENKMIFVKEAENAMAPVLLERYGAAASNQPTTRAARTAVNNRRGDFGASPSVAESK
jgi:ATP-dependent Clp protease ATP-binding subunit ClpB